MKNQKNTETIVAEITKLLVQRKQTIGIAESCTGGLLGHQITEYPGASLFFLGGIICYANEVKRSLVGVTEQALVSDGAVSESVVIEMARGIRDALGSDYGLAISGIAGPGGGSAGKPVGTVFIGWADKNSAQAFRYLFSGTRSLIKQQAVRQALEIIQQEIDT